MSARLRVGEWQMSRYRRVSRETMPQYSCLQKSTGIIHLFMPRRFGRRSSYNWLPKSRRMFGRFRLPRFSGLCQCKMQQSMRIAIGLRFECSMYRQLTSCLLQMSGKYTRQSHDRMQTDRVQRQQRLSTIEIVFRRQMCESVFVGTFVWPKRRLCRG